MHNIENKDLFEKLNRISLELENLFARCQKGVLKQEETEQFLQEVVKKIRETLIPDTDLYRLFDRNILENTRWWTVTRSGYVELKCCKNISYVGDIVSDLLKEIEEDMMKKTEQLSDVSKQAALKKLKSKFGGKVDYIG